MEENQEQPKKEYYTEPMCMHHPIMRSFVTGILIFLGAFCAFYVVSDWHLKHTMFRPIPRFMEKEKNDFMKMEKKATDEMLNFEKQNFRRVNNIIHIQQSEDNYRIIIDLRAFDNNENNVQVTTKGNILTIAGRTIRKSKNNEQISEFQQSYLFGDNVKLSDLKKETSGNYYIVSIPIE